MNPDQPNGIRLLTLGTLAVTGMISTGAAFGLSPGLVGVVVAVAVLEADLMWRVVRRDIRYRWARFRRLVLELMFLFLVTALTAAVLTGDVISAVGAWPAGMLTVHIGGAFVAAVTAWAATTATLDDLARLGELSDAMTDELLPVPRLRWRYLAYGVVVALGGAIGVAGWSSLIDLSRPLVGGVVWPAVVYFVVGAAAVVQVHRYDAGVRWRRQRMMVTSAVEERSRGAGALAGATILAVLLLLPARDGAPVVRLLGAGLRQIGRLGDWILTWFRLRDTRDPSEAADGSIVFPNEVALPEPDVSSLEPGEPLLDPATVDILRTVLVWSVVALVAGYALRVVWVNRSDLAASLRAIRMDFGIWRAVAKFPALVAAALLGALAGRFRRRPVEPRGGRTATEPTVSGGRAAVKRRRGLGDAGERMAEIYRSYLKGTEGVSGAKRPTETPAEYGARLILRRRPVQPHSDTITSKYEQLRYAPRPITSTDVREAQSALVVLLAKLESEETDDPPAGS